MPTITQHEMDRAKLVSEAGGYLLSAMDKFTAEHDELTAMEWIKAINDSLMRNKSKKNGANPMPDSAPLPPDVIRDDIAKADDRSIEAIARRVYEATFPHSSPYRHEIDSVCKRFEAALARELAPVRRVKDGLERVWVETSPGKFNCLECSCTLKTVEMDGKVTELPPAYVGKPAKPLDVKVVAAELWAAWFGFAPEADYERIGMPHCRQRFEAAIARLMGGAKAEPLQTMEAGDICEDCALTGVPGGLCPTHSAYKKFPRTVAELLAAALQIVGERHDHYVRSRNWPKVREYTDCLESLYEAMDQAAVKDSEIPF